MDLLDNFEMWSRQVHKTEASYALQYNELLTELLAEEICKEIDNAKLDECLRTVGAERFKFGGVQSKCSFYSFYIGQESITEQLNRLDRVNGTLYYIRLKQVFPEIMKVNNYV